MRPLLCRSADESQQDETHHHQLRHTMNANTNTAYHVAAILSEMYAEAAAGNLDLGGDMTDWFDTSAIESGADDTDAVYDALQDHSVDDVTVLADRWLADSRKHGDSEMAALCTSYLNSEDGSWHVSASLLYAAEVDAIASGARDE